MSKTEAEELLGASLRDMYSYNLDGLAVAVAYGKVSAFVIGAELPWKLNGELGYGASRTEVESLLGEPLDLLNSERAGFYYFDEQGQIDNSIADPAYVLQVHYGETEHSGEDNEEHDLYVVGLAVALSNEFGSGDEFSILPLNASFTVYKSGTGADSIKPGDLHTVSTFWEIEHRGEGSFVVRQGDDVLFSCEGNYHGRVILRPPQADAPLSIETEGEWSMGEMTTQVVYLPISGSGDWVCLHNFFHLGQDAGYNKLRISHKGTGDVLVQSVSSMPNPDSSEEEEPIVLLSGTGDCSAVLDLTFERPAGAMTATGLLEIVTDGSWVLELE